MSGTVQKRTRRKRTDPDEARETVLAAAEQLLRSGGPGALRLGEIAARAGLSHSNVLYHFEGMKDLEARLGRRIALRLAEDLAEQHRTQPAGELPSADSIARLFAVLGAPENARLISWMLASSKPEELLPLALSIRSTIALIAQHPQFEGLPSDLVLREVAETTQIAISTALGFGLIRPWISAVFSTEADEAMFAARIGALEREGLDRAKLLLTKLQ